MIINLSEILSRENCSLQKKVMAEFDQFSCRLGDFPIREKNDFILTVKHSKNGECKITGSTNFIITALCDRCLEAVDVSIEIVINRILYVNRKEKNDEESYEKNYIDGYNLDVDKLLYNEILIGWPMKILCSEDCKGICNVCGQNLNKGTCDCEDTSLDPRMSVIRDVFKNFKEV